MSTEYFDSHNSSSSFDSCKRRRIFSGDFKTNDFDNDSLVEFNAENSTKASSSSIQDSFANTSNSHSTPEDNSSENTALLSPFSKPIKADYDKDFDGSCDYYPKHQNGIFRTICSNSMDFRSIEDTIECVLSKIRETDDGSIKYSSGTHSTPSVKYEENHISQNSNYAKPNFPENSYHAISNTQSIKGDSGNYQNNYKTLNKSNNSQSFFDYGNYYSIPNNFNNQLNLPNYNRPTSFCKDSDKNNMLYHQYQCKNQTYRPYMTNSYLNQTYRPQSHNIQLQQGYQLCHKPLTKDTNHHNINFKTPQTNSSNVALLDANIRKKRPYADQMNVSPSKKRKVNNQLSINNSYDDLYNKLKTVDYNILLVNPYLTFKNSLLLPPLEVVENKKLTSDGSEKKTSLQYRKYQSSKYYNIKPKRFNNASENDKFLSNYVPEILDKVFLSDKDSINCDNLSDIICMSPSDDNNTSEDLLSNLHTTEYPNRDTCSPELLSSSFLKKYNINISSNFDNQINDYEETQNHFITAVVSYGDNEPKLITELQPSKDRDSSKYTQLTGSFLKRTKVNGKSFSTVHIEEAVSVASLAASKSQNSCHQCSTFLTGLSCIKGNRKLINTDSSEDYLFCSVSCFSKFKSNIILSDCNNTTKISPINISSKQNLKATSYKPLKNYKKLFDFEQYVRRRFPSEDQSDNLTKSPSLGDTTLKRLLGVNYRYFNNDAEKVSQLYNDICKEKQMYLLQRYSCAFKSNLLLIDKRACILCLNVGDGAEDVCGRLVNVGCGIWVHLNCGLWCFEVFETVSGSLMGVQLSIEKALKTQCSYCNNNGAGIPCYRSKCSSVYHVPCAYKVGCIFYTDRGMYCPSHAVLNHPMHLPSLKVDRRVNVYRDESALVAEVILDDQQEQKCKLRLGTLILNNIGQLLPEQLLSGHYNSRSIIYPIGYFTTRLYWSPFNSNKRCKYECHIEEENDRPLFKVVYKDDNNKDIVVSNQCCDTVWKSILNKIVKLREDSGQTKLFPIYLSGEQLYGLTEPHIIRIIESLPGVEMIQSYAFKFGKMQLITEMPLAINPTGSARTEPKLRTYIRRTQEEFSQCGILKAKCSQQIGLETSNISKFSVSNTNSRTQQYKKLKIEWMNSVILSRSKIQGLGLFAAKDFDKSVMIIEYIGECIRNEVGNRREQFYQSRNNSIYMFRLNDDMIIDATVNGGLARYINHSCNPNCVAEFLPLDCGGRIIISTKQRIERGEELTYDYKFDFEENKSNLIPCLCGAINCRKWMN